MESNSAKADQEAMTRQPNPDGTISYYPDLDSKVMNLNSMYPPAPQDPAGIPLSASQQPQTMETRDFIAAVLQADPFNYYCVDCKQNPATHASVTFGVLICENCATIHKGQLGMEKSYVKSLAEFWYDYQLKFLG